MRLRALTRDDVIAEWDWLRAGLLRMIEKTGAKYRPEDVYSRLVTGTAWAYAIDEDGALVLTQEYDHDGLVLFVWAMFGQNVAERKDEVYAELEQLARAVKAKRIRMQSPREGWERERFFTRVAVVYEHEVTT